MTDLHFYTLDVFTERPYGGNPVAIFPDAPPLSASQMQLVARELNLSETVFVRPATHPDALRQLRIFTPAMELPFAGHPTIGTAQLLVTLGVAGAGDDGSTRFLLEEAAGLVAIEVISENEAPSFTWLTTARLPERGPEPPAPADLAAMLGLAADDILAGPADAPRSYSGGVPYLYIPVRDRGALSRIHVDVGLWREKVAAFWAPHLYAFTGADSNPLDGRAVLAARMFAPAMGIVEDPATGAGVAGLAGYLWERDRRAGRWLIQQGIEMGRPSALHLELTADGGSLSRVRVGGSAVRMGEGSLRAPTG